MQSGPSPGLAELGPPWEADAAARGATSLGVRLRAQHTPRYHRCSILLTIGVPFLNTRQNRTRTKQSHNRFATIASAGEYRVMSGMG